MPLKIILNHQLTLLGVSNDLEEILEQNLKFVNPKWQENQRMGRRNKDTPQFLEFYEKKPDGSLILPRAYIRQFILLCRRHNISYKIDDQREILPEVEYEFSGRLKTFQQKAADAMLAKEFGTLNAPTGSGKTIIALYMIAKRRQSALVVVHTKDLAFQWMARIESFLKIPKEDIGLIGAGKRCIGKQITLALVQSLYKCAHEVAPNIGYLIVDECHRAPSRTFTEAVSSFNCKYMLGLTATPWRRDRLSRLIFWYLGDVHHEIDKNNLIQKGHILEAEVIMRETDFQPYYDPAREYSKMLSELTADDTRNHLIASDVALEAQKKEGLCLVLSDRKKHCQTIQFLLRCTHKISAELLTGDLSMANRQKVLDQINKKSAHVLIATGQLIGEGFDCKDLSTLFIATPVRFSGRLIQYLGRILRPAPGKTKAKVYDYVDIHVGPLRAAAMSRQQVYQDSKPR